MARNQERPMNDADLAEVSEQIQNLREEVREDLAADLGGDPDDYRAESHFRTQAEDSDEAAPDGGASTEDKSE